MSDVVLDDVNDPIVLRGKIPSQRIEHIIHTSIHPCTSNCPETSFLSPLQSSTHDLIEYKKIKQNADSHTHTFKSM